MLLTLAEVRSQVPQAVGLADAVLEAFIGRAESLAARACDAQLEEAERVETFSARFPRETLLLASCGPVTDATVEESLAGGSDWQEVSSDQWAVDAEAGTLERRVGRWPVGVETVRVTYTTGYTSATLPDDLRDALLELVGWRIGSRGQRGVVSSSADGVSETPQQLVRGVPEDLWRALRPWARGEGF